MKELFKRLAKLIGWSAVEAGKGRAPRSSGGRTRATDDQGRVDVSLPAPAPGEGSPRRSTKQGLYLIGLDFGTSGTKVAIRDLLSYGDPPTVIDMGTSAPGFVRFSLPSEVRIAQGRMIMGRPGNGSTGSSDGWPLPSPKVLLLHPQEKVEGALKAVARIPDEVEWRVNPTPAEGLAALFLAEVLRGAYEGIEAMSPGPKKILVNVGVPVDRLDQSAAARHFQRALDAAVLLADEFDRPESAEEAFLQWRRTLRRLKESPPEPETRRGNLVAEAQAAMMGMGTALRLESGGLYAILDAGAATTDMGIFRYTRFPDRELVAFYAARSQEGGCDDLDRSVAGVLLNGKGAETAEVHRIFREARVRGSAHGWPQEISLKSYRFELQGGHVDAAVDELGEVICESYSQLWGEAYRKEKNTDEWEVLRTLIVGGGSLTARLKTRLLERPRSFCAAEEVPLSGRVHCEVAGASDAMPTAEELPFLFVALGLCGVQPEMPDILRPSEIRPVGPISQGPTGVYQFSWDDLYSK